MTLPMPAASEWPYPKEPSLGLGSEPSWMCPGGECRCHPSRERELREFHVMLCDPEGNRMPRARFRALVRGAVRQDAEADDDGWATVVVQDAVDSVSIEWAPPDLPPSPEFPYRKRYFVELRTDDDAEASRRRLHNLGFSRAARMQPNVRDFQKRYGYTTTGDYRDIAAPLIAFHDLACLPAKGRPIADDEQELDSAAQFLSGPDVAVHDPSAPPLALQLLSGTSPSSPHSAPTPAPPAAPPPPPASQGHAPLGGGTPPGLGTAQPAQSGRPSPQTFLQLLSFSVTVPPIRAFINTHDAPEVTAGDEPNNVKVVALGKVRAGPSAFGFLFLRQFVEHALGVVRDGRRLTLSWVPFGVDHFHVMGGARGPHSSVRRVTSNPSIEVKGTDLPGIALDHQPTAQNAQPIRPDVRVTLMLHASFATYLVWSPDHPSNHNCANWAVLTGKRWSMLALGSGISGTGTPPWASPQEAFHVCSPTIPLPPQQTLQASDFPPCNAPVSNAQNAFSTTLTLGVGAKDKTAIENGC